MTDAITIEQKIAAMAHAGNPEAMTAWAIMRVADAMKKDGEKLGNIYGELQRITRNVNLTSVIDAIGKR